MRYNSRNIPGVVYATPEQACDVLASLTPEQTAAMPLWRDWWISVGLSTERADRPAMEAAVRKAYAAFGYNFNPEMVWVESPRGLRDEIKKRAPKASWRNFTGSVFSLGWTSYATFLKDVGGVRFPADLDARVEAFRAIHEAGSYFWPSEQWCVLVDRPTVLTRDEAGRMHNTSGPAIAYSDGWALYYAHGINIPKYVITEPERITIAQVEEQDNLEVKRVFIEQYGVHRYLQDAGWEMEHKDETGELYVRKTRANERDREPPQFPVERMVRVWNGTVEHGGRIREFCLPVHPELRPMKRRGNESVLGEPQEPTACAAVASTYGLRAEQYVVAVRT